jgi:hypothetical protein
MELKPNSKADHLSFEPRGSGNGVCVLTFDRFTPFCPGTAPVFKRAAGMKMIAH